MSDGAATVVVMARERAEALGLKPLSFVGFTNKRVERNSSGGTGSGDPNYCRVGVGLEIDLIELNEAFAWQVLAGRRELPIDPDRLNVNGGAVALGHPLGCTGARLTTSVLYEMARRGSRYGMVTMCVGGGMGAAGMFERC